MNDLLKLYNFRSEISEQSSFNFNNILEGLILKCIILWDSMQIKLSAILQINYAKMA